MKPREHSLSDRMKSNYENRAKFLLPRRTYTIIRLDGKAFHSYTKRIGAKKPYDENLISRMDLTTKFLCSNIQGCVLGYTQSDEISLLLTDFATTDTEAWFNGNVQKISSVSASLASSFFNSISSGIYGHKVYEDVDRLNHHDVNDWVLLADKELAFFDARTFSIPDKIEVYNYFVWRIKDWERNSLQMLARSHYSHKELMGKGTSDLHELIHKAGDNWSKYPDTIKRGRICSNDVGGMWGIYAAPDIRDINGKEKLTDLIPSHGY